MHADLQTNTVILKIFLFLGDQMSQNKGKLPINKSIDDISSLFSLSNSNYFKVFEPTI